ncbi:MAG TPA: aminotransferase class V-fold PLP-dependent enzyme [Candidatus Limnocylindria bacterium]|nr:aminotransferase class V-fold PLP-dependent enzyme [Candidatus Limnocylindria bacterium]
MPSSAESAGEMVWSSDDVRRVGRQVVELIAGQLEQATDGPVFRPYPQALAEVLAAEGIPRQGSEPDAVLDDFSRLVGPYPLGNGHPRFWAWVCSPPAVMAVFAEALAAAMNPHCDVANHAAIHIERQVLDWFKDIIGFPRSSGGLLVSGGSMANLTALAVARHAKGGVNVRREGLQGQRQKLLLYVSEEGHSCLRKASELLGIGSANIRVIPTDARFRMRVDELTAQLLLDLAAGHRPLAVVASAGTTNTGSIDPLEEIAEVCRRHAVWLHVDGAYGAPAVVSRHYREQLSALSLADSVALDPHKWLQIPVEAGSVLVKDAGAMRDAFSLVPPYLRQDGNAQGVEGPISFAEFGFEQTRGSRALKIWMTIRHHGLDALARVIEDNIELARLLYRRVEEDAELEVMAPQELSVVCFRYAPPHLHSDPALLDALNRALVERLQLGGEAFLAGTLVRGAYALRACIVNYLSRPQDVEITLAAVKRLGAELAADSEALVAMDVAAHLHTPEQWGEAGASSMTK